MQEQRTLTTASKEKRAALLQWAIVAGALILVVLCTAGMLSLSGCKPAALPPGALNQGDFAAYDFLSTLQGAINGFKTTYATFTPAQQAQVKTQLNQAVADYNLAEAAWQAYHAAGSGDLTNVNTLIDNVLNDISALQTSFSQQSGTPAITPVATP